MHASAEACNERVTGWKPGVPLYLLCLEFVTVSMYRLWTIAAHTLERLPYYDQVLFEQAMRSFMRGNGLTAPLENVCPLWVSHSAVHFQPILYFLAPIYTFHPDTMTIKILEIGIVFSSCIPLYLLARRMFASRWAGWMLGTMLLMDWTLNAELSCDFHPINLVIPAYFWSLYFIHKNAMIPAVFAASIGLLTKETEAFTLSMLGMYLIMFRRRFRSGTAMIGTALVWSVLVFGFVFPAYNMGADKVFIDLHYNHLGTSVWDIALNVFRSPELFIKALFNPVNGQFFRGQFARFGYLPLLSLPELLPVLPSIAFVLFSNEPIHKFIWGHYTSAMLPFMYLAFMTTLLRFRRIIERRNRTHARQRVRWGAQCVMAYAICVAVFHMDYLLYKPAAYPVLRDIPQSFLREMEHRIPGNATVAMDMNFVPYFYRSHSMLQNYPHEKSEPDWCAFYLHPRDPKTDAYIPCKVNTGLSDDDRFHEMHRRFARGFLPAFSGWQDGFFALSRDETPEGLRFQRLIHRETVAGFNMTDHGRSDIDFLFHGFSFREPEGSWSEGNRCRVLFCIAEDVGKDLLIRVRGHHPVQYLPDQTIEIRVNDIDVDTLPLMESNPDIRIRVPRDVLHPGINHMEIQFDATFTPCSVGLNDDCRVLAFKFQSIDFSWNDLS